MDALRSGQTGLARRQFELLVARHPESPLAGRARAALREIYAAEATGAPAVATRHPTESVRPAAPDAAKGWTAKIKPPKAPEADFAATVGDRVFFSEGGAELGGRARLILAAQARWLNDHPAVPLVIEGYADDPGSIEHNASLARRRAEAVRARLVEEGVSAVRIRIVVDDREPRIVTCREADCRHLNRLVVTVVGRSAQPLAAAPPSAGAFPVPMTRLGGPRR
ncbi:MAG TPA: OmpA family protein [Hyphomicrobiaceae bacterium]|nr:OmpA family protein [Hyphomicrobiaceae bacterium]